MGKLDLFGNHKREIWQQLCERIDGDFFRGNWRRHDRIEAFHGNWVVVIDTYTVDKMTYTRIRAPFVNRDDFQFRIYRSNSISRLATRFGLTDIQVGIPEFDHHFIIRGSDERKLKMLFANPDVRELINYQPKIFLELKRDAYWFEKPKFPKGVNELYFRTPSIIKDLERLHDLFELFAVTLDHLCRIGTAEADPPRFFYDP